MERATKKISLVRNGDDFTKVSLLVPDRREFLQALNEIEKKHEQDFATMQTNTQTDAMTAMQNYMNDFIARHANVQ